MSDLKKDVLSIDGIYYDTEKLALMHPGGAMMVRLCNGRECTAIFLSYHRRRFPHALYEQYQVPKDQVHPGSLIEQRQQPSYDSYLELCKRIQPIIAPTKGFAPWYYYLKAAFWLTVMLGLDLYSLFYRRAYFLTVIQSLSMAMVGLNVQHDANHGALSRDWRVNRILGLSQDMLGGSSISWIVNHDYVHHIYTNEPGRDADLEIPLLRLHSGIPVRLAYCLQQFYIFFLEAAFGPAHVLFNIIFLAKGPSEKQRLIKTQWVVSLCMLSIIPYRLLCNFLHATSFCDGVMSCVLQYALGGFYLAYFFLLSHNFDGAKKVGTSDGQDFVACQGETSCNFGGWWWGQINGGLNFQIEHHLFPRVHHGYYAYLAPIVRKFCEERGFTYTHYHTIQENMMSTFRHMEQYGRGREKRKSA
ncbi:delta-6 fatty acid desaturase, putative [Leishmania donovani]|uniref:Delta-4 fatty acid desaturase n=1 Tax=Leishmania donovani TaxID=5661 RepID=A0A3Q8I9Z6_LEIDO|nr:delta-6 fatty acid desaturase, putative [Leishmania donovani]AYU77393.1 delta-4 fatty acid desaturase [Leishmania donovani]TPP46324.1 Fatty acid desaturase family protein [Leishmania donovani]CBZ32800.1 delta-6 fatty acid desaturase, putative [Leishmania donovani]